MDKETAFSMGLAAASFLPGPVGLVARGASVAMLAKEGWQHRDDLARVVNQAIGVTPAEAQETWNGQSPIQRPGEGGQRKKKYADPGRGLTHEYGNGPRLPTRPATNTESAATPAAPVTAPKPAMPAPQSVAAPAAPTTTVAEKSVTQRELEALERSRAAVEDRMNREFSGSGGTGQRGAGPNYERLQKEKADLDTKITEARKSVQNEQYGWMNAASAVGLVVAGGAGFLLSRYIGARAAASAVEGAKNLLQLGVRAKKLTAAKGVLVGTAKGDALKGVVAAARPAQKAVSDAPAAVAASAKLTKWLKVGAYVDTGASGYISLTSDDPGVKAYARVAAAAGMGVGFGLSAGSAVALSAARRLAPAGATAVINEAKHRLAREAAGGAMRASKHRIGAEVAGAKQGLIEAQTATKIGGVKGEHAVAGAKKIGRIKVGHAAVRAEQGAPVVVAGKRPVLTKAAQKVEAKARAQAAARAVATKEAKRKKAIQGSYELGRHRGAQEVAGNRALALQGGKGWSPWARYQAAVKQGHKWKGPVPKRPEGKAPKRMAPPRLAVAA